MKGPQCLSCRLALSIRVKTPPTSMLPKAHWVAPEGMRCHFGLWSFSHPLPHSVLSCMNWWIVIGRNWGEKILVPSPALSLYSNTQVSTWCINTVGWWLSQVYLLLGRVHFLSEVQEQRDDGNVTKLQQGTHKGKKDMLDSKCFQGC